MRSTVSIECPECFRRWLRDPSQITDGVECPRCSAWLDVPPDGGRGKVVPRPRKPRKSDVAAGNGGSDASAPTAGDVAEAVSAKRGTTQPRVGTGRVPRLDTPPGPVKSPMVSDVELSPFQLKTPATDEAPNPGTSDVELSSVKVSDPELRDELAGEWSGETATGPTATEPADATAAEETGDTGETGETGASSETADADLTDDLAGTWSKADKDVPSLEQPADTDATGADEADATAPGEDVAPASISPRLRYMLGEFKDGDITADELLAETNDPAVAALLQDEIDQHLAARAPTEPEEPEEPVATGEPADDEVEQVAPDDVAMEGDGDPEATETVDDAAVTTVDVDPPDSIPDVAVAETEPFESESEGEEEEADVESAFVAPADSPDTRTVTSEANLPDATTSFVAPQPTGFLDAGTADDDATETGAARVDDGSWSDDATSAVEETLTGQAEPTGDDDETTIADPSELTATAVSEVDDDINAPTVVDEMAPTRVLTFADVGTAEPDGEAAVGGDEDDAAEAEAVADTAEPDADEYSGWTADPESMTLPVEPLDDDPFGPNLTSETKIRAAADIDFDDPEDSRVWSTRGAGFDIGLLDGAQLPPLALGAGATPTDLDIRVTPSLDPFGLGDIPDLRDDATFADDLIANLAVAGTFDPFLGDFRESSGEFGVGAPDMFDGVNVDSGPFDSRPPEDAVAEAAPVVSPRQTEAAGWSAPPIETITAPAATLRPRSGIRRLATQPEVLAGIQVGAAAEIESPPEPRYAVAEASAPLIEPTPGSMVAIGDASYRVMSADDAVQRLLRTGDLPEGTYVHQLDLGYYPDNPENPSAWYLRPYLHSRMVQREEDFHIPRQGPTSSDCLPVIWPRRPVRLHRCCFGTLNISRAHFPAGFTMTESRVLRRVSAVRVRFDGWTDCSRTVFAPTTAFFQARATGPVTFRQAVFPGVAWFAELRFDGYTSFRGADLLDDVDFSGARIQADLDLHDTIVMGRADMGQLQVQGQLDMGDAGVHGELNLQLARVDGRAVMTNMICGSEVQLNRTRFESEADFSQARFGGAATFEHARFGEDLRLSRAAFGSVADFYAIEVDGAFDLTDAVFHGDTVLATGRFQGMVRMNVDAVSRSTSLASRAADFRGNLRADHAVFHKPVLASSVRFRGKTTFRRVTFEESASFADAVFTSGFDLSSSFAARELDLRSATIGGRMNLDGVHVGGRATLSGAHFRAISLSDATITTLAIEREQLYPNMQDLRENRPDAEVPPFRPRERSLPVKLFHYRHAVMGADPALPGARPQNLSRDRRREAKQQRLAGGMDAQLRLEEGGARLVAFDRAREEFLLLERSFRSLGRREEADQAWVFARRMDRSARVIAGRGVLPVDESLLAVEREITRLEQVRTLIETDDVSHARFPAELKKRRDALLAGEGDDSAESWARLKDLVLSAVRNRLEPLQDKRRRVLDRLGSLERPATGRLAWRLGIVGDYLLDAASDYGTKPWRLARIGLFLIIAFAAFFTRYSYLEESTLPADPAQRAAARAIVFEGPEYEAAGEPVVIAWAGDASDPADATRIAHQPPRRAGTLRDPVATESVGERFIRYTVYSFRAFTCQGFSGPHPRDGHWITAVVILEMLSGILLLIALITAAGRRVMR